MQTSRKERSRSGTAALVFSATAALILAFLTAFGIIQSCSPANIAIFLVLLIVSSVLAISGVIIAGISYRRDKNRMASMSLLFTVLYAALLVYLLQLMQ